MAGPEEDEEPEAKTPSPDSDPSDLKYFTKNRANLSSQAEPNSRIGRRLTRE